MTYFLLFVFALAPSFIWLAFYLRKDAHPEPNRMIVNVFFAGAAATIPAIYLEEFAKGFFSTLPLPPSVFLFVYFLLGIALTEELLKYLVVKFSTFRSSVLEEPLDLMLYMIIAALGFAASENIILLFRLLAQYPIGDIVFINAVRFFQAIFLHALASGLLGYFLAIAALNPKRRAPLVAFGFCSAVALHGLFNFYIVNVGAQNMVFLLLPIAPLFAVAVFISFGFRKLKQAHDTKDRSGRAGLAISR